MNESIIPESLREVWRWKESVARKYADLSAQERIRRMNEVADRFLAEHGIALRRTAPGPRAK